MFSIISGGSALADNSGLIYQVFISMRFLRLPQHTGGEWNFFVVLTIARPILDFWGWCWYSIFRSLKSGNIVCLFFLIETKIQDIQDIKVKNQLVSALWWPNYVMETNLFCYLSANIYADTDICAIQSASQWNRLLCKCRICIALMFDV